MSDFELLNKSQIQMMILKEIVEIKRSEWEERRPMWNCVLVLAGDENDDYDLDYTDMYKGLVYHYRFFVSNEIARKFVRFYFKKNIENLLLIDL